jgi:hypothetical protein
MPDSRKPNSVRPAEVRVETALHSIHSSYRESLLEHLFVGDLLRTLWLKGHVLAEVMKPQVDDAGYDLVIDCNGVTRHIQLKASYQGARTARQTVHSYLGRKPSGCVIWVRFDPSSLKLGPFLWFGAAPGKRLPDVLGLRVARHTKGDAHGHKAPRPNLRVLPAAMFERVETMEALIVRLFGALPGRA